MLQLKKLAIEDKIWIDPFVMAEETESADFCFGNMFVWNPGMDQRVGIFEGRLIIRICQTDVPFFAFPIGKGPLVPLIEEMKTLSGAEGYPLIIAGITEKHRERMEEEMPGAFEFKAEENYFDYIYETEKLSSLAGKKLHGKRNHINKFISLYPDWHYEELKKEHFEECKKLLDEWNQAKGFEDTEDAKSEKEAIMRAFDHYDELKLEGGVLYANGHLCAFTMGEKCARNVFLVHFEKADVETEGAYTMINREFVRMIAEKHPEVDVINRGDDMGLDSLRQAKRSYKPLGQVVKYTAKYTV